ncbi:hypothetical protein X777_11752 [Ooceraea biroi]|uniref:Uncharacterized protein n=1 Tax=Ooceraea biroi TaxID=2015173 RepID=A0A026W2Q3_OOCBI|nr:hypothetical protein X777_11752 [Ooceraea biroi]
MTLYYTIRFTCCCSKTFKSFILHVIGKIKYTLFLHYYSSWPDLKNICKEEEHKECLDFKELVGARLNCRKELHPFLTKLSEKHYYCFYESLLSEDITWRMWLDEYRYRSHSKKVFVEEKELDALMHSNKVTHHLTDLTYIYYGKELLPHVRHYYLKPMWHEFMNRPIKQQILEEAATLVAQWFQPEQHISYSYVTTELENIAQQVMERLEVVNPQHQIFSVSREQISSWKSNNIDKDEWNNSDAREILNILSEILFQKQKFQGIRTFGNTDFLQNYLCVNYVSYSL